MIKLSLIIPIYNVEKYIYSCLESVFFQNVSESDYEVIVINDGTPDDSMKIVFDFASKHKNLIITEQENQGLSVARNEGLKIAKGEYIWFIDSDDSIVENCLGIIFRLIDVHKADVFISPLITYDEATGLFGNRNLVQELKSRSISGLDFLLLKIDFVPMQIYVIKRTLLIDNSLQFYPGIYHEDKEFAPRMLYYANSVHICLKPSYVYLLRSRGSITSSVNMKHIQDKMKICYSLQKFSINQIIEEKGRQIFKFLEISYLFSIISQLHLIQDNKRVNAFLLENNNYIRNISFNALFSNNIRFIFFGILASLHPRLLILYYKFR